MFCETNNINEDYLDNNFPLILKFFVKGTLKMCESFITMTTR